MGGGGREQEGADGGDGEGLMTSYTFLIILKNSKRQFWHVSFKFLLTLVGGIIRENILFTLCHGCRLVSEYIHVCVCVCRLSMRSI